MAPGRLQARIVFDLDIADASIPGHQEGRFFHDYYGGYRYLPLCVFCGDRLLAATLPRSNISSSADAAEAVPTSLSAPGKAGRE